MATFDTLSVVKDLQGAGFAQNQAEAVATAIRAGQGDLPTRNEFLGLRGELVGLRSELAGMRSELVAVKWVLGLMAALNLSTLATVIGHLVSA